MGEGGVVYAEGGGALGLTETHYTSRERHRDEIIKYGWKEVGKWAVGGAVGGAEWEGSHYADRPLEHILMEFNSDLRDFLHSYAASFRRRVSSPFFKRLLHRHTNVPRSLTHTYAPPPAPSQSYSLLSSFVISLRRKVFTRGTFLE